jgi:uncharacterized membrane protein
VAGIGVKLNKIFEKKSILSGMFGVAYSTTATVAPMFLVIGVVILMQWVMGYSKIAYSSRELFASTILYIFIFSLLCAAPFSAVLSKYLSDTIFEERYEDIMPCFYVGLVMNVLLGSVVGIPFCVRETIVGGVPIYYTMTTYLGFMSLILVFYSMLYLSITKDYSKITLYFFIGMFTAFLLSLWFRFRLEFEVTYSVLLALVIGFCIVASLEIARIHAYFHDNSGRYRQVLKYFRKYWQLIAVNFIYVLGLYIHNFVFWTTDEHTIVVKSFVSHTTYDMATCLAMFTNLSATVIFISRIEMHFHERYRAYSEAVIGGRGIDIRNAKSRMFRALSTEIMSLARLQFIITVVAYLFCIILLPLFGFGGETMQIYPLLAVAYFIMFLMYALILFLYYFNDLYGAILTSLAFLIGTFAGALLAIHLPVIWYGSGLLIGASAGWITGYLRLHWIEVHIDEHIFCNGHILKSGAGSRPDNRVYQWK